MVCIDLRPDDEERLREFYDSLGERVTATFQPFPEITTDVIRKHLTETNAGHHISVGIEHSSKIVGHGFVMDTKKQHPVFGIGISGIFQGHGWGRRLMSVVFEKALACGVRHMTLTVLKYNSKALSLYSSFGFRVVTDHTFKAANDSYFMRYDREVL